MRSLPIWLVLVSTFALLGAPLAWADDAPGAPAAPPVATDLPPAPPAPPASDVLGCCPQPCCPAPCCQPPCPRLEIQGHVALLTPGLEGPVTFDAGGANPILWDGLDYGLAVGGGVTYSFPWRRYTVQVGGLFWGHWDESVNATGTFGAGNPPTTSPVIAVVLNSKATLWSVNASVLKPVICTECLDVAWGLGLRSVHFDEESGHTVVVPTGSVTADVDNWLIAVQLVGEATWKLRGAWDFRARGAAFGGWLHREVEVNTVTWFGVGTSGPITVKDDTFGFGAELELSVGYRACNGWVWRAGYGALLLTSIARGDVGADFSNTNNPPFSVAANLGEEVLLAHRLFLGLSIDF